MTSNNKTENSSFWMSYASLMAGLFFIITLILSVLLTKYDFLVSDLNKSQDILATKADNLSIIKSDLKKRELAIDNVLNTLQNSADKSISIDELKIILNQSLNEAKKSIELANAHLGIKEDIKDDTNQSIEQNASLINQANALNQEKIKLSKQEQAELKSTQKTIKSVNALRLKIVAKLKILLGDSLQIDPKTGTIIISSDSIFESNASLKQSSKTSLERSLRLYFDVLLSNEIQPYIKRIIIESYTDSNKTYANALRLSTAQALELMLFIRSFYKDAHLERYLMASGRGSAQPVYVDNAIDYNASRRIELRFLPDLEAKGFNQDINASVQDKTSKQKSQIIPKQISKKILHKASNV